LAYDEKAAERIRHLLADRADLYERKMMGGVAFMVKGGMCCAVSGRGGLLVRLGPDLQARALEEPHVRPMIMRGRPGRGFVRVAAEGYRTPAALKKWVQRGLDFVATLPSKTAKGAGAKRPTRK
jgi:hypothetical protein